METKNREKLYLIGIGVLVGLYLLDLIVVSPLIDSWHSRTAEIAALHKKISEGNRMVRYESTTRDTWDNMRANALSTSPTAASREMFTEFDRWVNSSRVAEGSFHPQVQEGESNYSTVDCRSDVTGNLDNIRDFVRALNRDPMANKVDSFTLTSKDDNGRQLALDLGQIGLILTDNDPSQFTNTPAPPQPPEDANSTNSPFKIIALNNIFDQNRVGPRTNNGERTRTPPSPRPDTITAHGSFIDHGVGTEYFDGSKLDSGLFKVGSTVRDLIVAKITANTVTLTNAGSNSFVLPVDGSVSLRRDEDGPWHRSDTASLPAASSSSSGNTASTVSTSTPPPASAGASSIEEFLRKRRESAN